MINTSRELKILPPAPGLQGYLVFLPFDFPEDAISRVLTILEPLVQRRIPGDEEVHIQVTGNTVEAVLQDLARQISLM